MKKYLALILVFCAALPTMAQRKPNMPPPPEERNNGVMVKPAPKKPSSNISMGQVRPATTSQGSVQSLSNRPNNNLIAAKPAPPRPEAKTSASPKQKPAPKPQAKPQPKPQPKPAPKPQPKPAPKPVAPAPHHKPATPPPAVHHPHHPDRNDYVPGFHRHPLPPPRERHYYYSWIPLRWKETYSFEQIPLQMSCDLHTGKKIIFYFEENTTTGYTWFARYDANIVDVDIEHQGGGFFGFAGAPGRAEIKIRGRNEGYTVVELVYARSWEWTNGAAPAKVVQIFIDSHR